MNLAFFSGNEVFWKTRWEPSIDGTNTSYRTLVCYKETAANAKTDPTPTWTGTWMDPRFSPPSDGGRPQNALSGTLFTAQAANDPMSVPAADGKFRFWRNTSMATLAPGTVGTLPVGVVGYEFDTDADNGFRPRRPVRPVVGHDAGDQRGVPLGYRVLGRAGHAELDDVPSVERCARLRRGHDPVVVGTRRDP